MYFLIGMIIFIIFLIVFYFVLKAKIIRFFQKLGFPISQLDDIIRDVHLDEEDTPKSLSSMDSIYLKKIEKDFPNIDISKLKRKAETVLMDIYHSIEKGDISMFNGKIKAFAEEEILNHNSISDLKIHNTVISRYYKNNNKATISFSIAYQYYLFKNGCKKKIQDRVREEFVYSLELEEKSSSSILDYHCPNCGSPFSSIDDDSCVYCGSKFYKLLNKIFICIDVVRY